jgi:hypothetical protein
LAGAQALDFLDRAVDEIDLDFWKLALAAQKRGFPVERVAPRFQRRDDIRFS